MRIKIGALLLALSLPAYAGDVLDRTQIPVRIASTGKYVGTLAPKALFFQIVPVGGGSSSGGAAGPFTSVTVGTTTTAGTATCVIDSTMAGASATDNFIGCDGTSPTVMAAQTTGYRFSLTGAGTSVQILTSVEGSLLAGYTGSQQTRAGFFQNTSNSTQTAFPANGGTGGSNAGVVGLASANTTGYKVGVYGVAKEATNAAGAAVGGYFTSSNAAADGFSIGLVGVGQDSGTAFGTNPVLGVWATLGGVMPSGTVGAALGATNGATTTDIFRLYDNTTLKVSVADGGSVQIGNNQLTAGTMTVNATGIANAGVSSYSWTNAMVVALGGSLTGDILVATLPAKTQVKNAYVIINSQCASTASLTVAVGTVAAGYIDLIVASNAQVAANSIYGDGSAERGTNLTGYFLPSYTGTTAVNAHFISTVQNLSAVTSCTGTVILETSLVP